MTKLDRSARKKANAAFAQAMGWTEVLTTDSVDPGQFAVWDDAVRIYSLYHMFAQVYDPWESEKEALALAEKLRLRLQQNLYEKGFWKVYRLTEHDGWRAVEIMPTLCEAVCTAALKVLGETADFRFNLDMPAGPGWEG